MTSMKSVSNETSSIMSCWNILFWNLSFIFSSEKMMFSLGVWKDEEKQERGKNQRRHTEIALLTLFSLFKIKITQNHCQNSYSYRSDKTVTLLWGIVIYLEKNSSLFSSACGVRWIFEIQFGPEMFYRFESMGALYLSRINQSLNRILGLNCGYFKYIILAII